MLIKERPIGYIFSIDKVVLRVDEDKECKDCYFNGTNVCEYLVPCQASKRKDGKEIIYRKIYEYPEV